MKETLEIQNSLAAPLILILTLFLQIVPVFLSHLKEKRGSWNAKEIELKQQIKELLKEAAPLSNPSTFAQAALLRRKAAAKEKELQQCQELHKQKNQSSFDMCLKAISVLKVIAYPLLILWFWRNPVAVVPQQLVQPLGRILSWRTLDPVSSHIMVKNVSWIEDTRRSCTGLCTRQRNKTFSLKTSNVDPIGISLQLRSK